jgi:S1-C subfamily serine protease
MRMLNTRSMKAARVAVAAAVLFTAAPFVASQSAGAVEQEMAAAPWRIDFADVVQKVRPAVLSISVKVVEETHGRGKPRDGASVGSGFFISPDGYAKLPDEPLKAADSVGRPTSRRGGVSCHARLCR